MENPTWTDVIIPLAARFEESAMRGEASVWDAEHSAAMSELLLEMAGRLDIAVASALRMREPY